AVKGSRYVSHIKRLAVEQKSIDMVVEPAVRLGEKLGPILFQLQANFHLDLERLARFLAMLPDHPRFAFEFRHDSWLIPAVCDLLRAHRIALCIPDHPKMPKVFEITSDFAYVRMHLPSQGLGYGKRALQPWADRAGAWRARGLDVFVYFNNDMEGHAIKDASHQRWPNAQGFTRLARYVKELAERPAWMMARTGRVAVLVGVLMCLPGGVGLVLGFILRDHRGSWLVLGMGLLFLTTGLGYIAWGAMRLRSLRRPA
ncbi:MAG: DUF72 domain-containing protein, partial [Chloroflexi bacterium]